MGTSKTVWYAYQTSFEGSKIHLVRVRTVLKLSRDAFYEYQTSLELSKIDLLRVPDAFWTPKPPGTGIRPVLNSSEDVWYAYGRILKSPERRGTGTDELWRVRKASVLVRRNFGEFKKGLLRVEDGVWRVQNWSGTRTGLLQESVNQWFASMFQVDGEKFDADRAGKFHVLCQVYGSGRVAQKREPQNTQNTQKGNEPESVSSSSESFS